MVVVNGTSDGADPYKPLLRIAFAGNGSIKATIFTRHIACLIVKNKMSRYRLEATWCFTPSQPLWLYEGEPFRR